jgi:hypothetical protein
MDDFNCVKCGYKPEAFQAILYRFQGELLCEKCYKEIKLIIKKWLGLDDE